MNLLPCFLFSILTIVFFTIIALIFSFFFILLDFALLKITLTVKLKERMKSKGNEKNKEIFLMKKKRGEKKS